MDILINLVIVFFAFWAMEFVAWFSHKYIMHGFLWVLHEDHHNQPKGFLQKNDAFFLIFAVPSMLSIMFGALFNIIPLVSVGIGILLYGIAYFLMHEVLVHKRYKALYNLLFKNSKSKYLKALLKAHYAHHKHLTKDGGESFGMLIFHPKYIELAKEK